MFTIYLNNIKPICSSNTIYTTLIYNICAERAANRKSEDGGGVVDNLPTVHVCGGLADLSHEVNTLSFSQHVVFADDSLQQLATSHAVTDMRA